MDASSTDGNSTPPTCAAGEVQQSPTSLRRSSSNEQSSISSSATPAAQQYVRSVWFPTLGHSFVMEPQFSTENGLLEMKDTVLESKARPSTPAPSAPVNRALNVPMIIVTMPTEIATPTTSGNPRNEMALVVNDLLKPENATAARGVAEGAVRVADKSTQTDETEMAGDEEDEQDEW